MKRLLMSIVLLVVLLGCSNKREVVTVGIIRVPNDTVVAIENGWIEDAFDAYDLDVEFKFFDSGVAMNQAFASGSLDIAEMGFTNGVVALSKNIPVKLFWIHDIIGDNEALVVKDAINDVSDLKGKNIATIFSSTSHLSLLKVLEENNISVKDVNLLNMETAEIVAAWNRDDLDAAYTWEPTLSKIKASGHVLLTSSDLAEKGVMTTNIGLVSDAFSEKHPEAVKAFVESMIKSKDLYDNDFDSVISDASKYLELEEDLVNTQIKGMKWIDVEDLRNDVFVEKFVTMFVDTSQYWYEQGFIDRPAEKKDVYDFIDFSYIEEVER